MIPSMNLYLFNVGFEDELMAKPSSPLALQLQFLPFHLAARADAVIVTHAPDPAWPAPCRYHLIDTPQNFAPTTLHYWGASPTVRKFCQEKNIALALPSHTSVVMANSKSFSFSRGEKLQGATIITRPEQALAFLANNPLPCIFKSELGYSGFGKMILQKKEKIPALLQWLEGKTVLAEPFVQRVCDFSLHFTLQQDGTYSFLGFTRMINTALGAYERSFVGEKELLFGPYLPLVQEAKNRADLVLQSLAAIGYFGPVGIDAMLYQDPSTGQIALQHCLEINARMTMGRYCLLLKQKLASNSPLSTLFVAKTATASDAIALLPTKLAGGLSFPKMLFFQPLAQNFAIDDMKPLESTNLTNTKPL